MADWDKIYVDYQQGGEAWATLSEGIHPLFKQFLNQSNFKHQQVLDIGCGTGKYASWLINQGFQVDGIDSSPTAVQMTKDLLGGQAGMIKEANMFKFSIAKNKYDLIISVATIQHGIKKDIQNLINKIHSALVAGGKTFITMPDLESSKKWKTFKSHQDLGDSTFAPLAGPEQGLPHSFFTKVEVQKLFAKFSKVKINLDDRGRWVVQAAK
ncbi:MAG: class I SAM-dependent methyltransferase [Patescibacteria group bacterium]|nr:class I SAM-dependent methyltransferase [Patescibacteria group bacterium]